MNNQQLGELRQQFSTNQISRYIMLLVGIGCFGGGLYMIIKVFLDTKEPVLLILISVLGLGICLLGLLILKRFRETRGASVELYENGLTANLNGKRHSAVWSDITSVKELIEAYYVNGVHTSDRYVYTIETTGGDSFSFDNAIFQTRQIGREIKEETFDLMYPPALQKLKTGGGGEAVDFGSLSISQDGVSLGSSKFLWSSLAAVEVKDGIIAFKDKDGKIVIEAIYAVIPNAHVLMALLREFIT